MDFGGKYYAIWAPIWLLCFGIGFGLVALIIGNGNATQPQQIASSQVTTTNPLESESKWEPSSVSTPKALIGQWYCSERDWTIFINSDGDYLLQYPNGGVSPWKLTVVTEIPRRSPEAAAFHISLHRKHIPAGKNIHKIEFSEDFKSFQSTYLGGSTRKADAYVYVDSKERP